MSPDHSISALLTPAGVALHGKVQLRPMSLDDAPALTAAFVENSEHLAPWEPVRPAEYFTAAGQKAIIERSLADAADARGYVWVMADGETIVGRIALSDIVGGAFQNGHLGYWIAASRQGQGLMSAAVGLVCELAREELGLHRIQAGTLLHNLGSQRVLGKHGFARIGVAEKYLRIAGQWQDHLLFQKILQPTGVED